MVVLGPVIEAAFGLANISWVNWGIILWQSNYHTVHGSINYDVFHDAQHNELLSIILVWLW